MKDFKGKKQLGKKIIFIILFVFSFSFMPLHAADAWLSIPAALIGNATDWLMKNIEGMIVGMIKQSGAIAINKMMSNIVGGGSSGQALFITEWDDYLRTQPKQKAQSYMNDYLTQMTQGRGSISSYTPTEFFEGVGAGAFNTGVSQYGNYFSRLRTMGEKAVAAKGSAASVPQPTYTGNPSDMFSQLNFKQLDVYTSGVNNPWAFTATVEEKYLQEQEDLKNEAMTKAIAGQGFTGTEVNGITISPGSLAKEKMAGVEDIGNKILANTQSLGSVMTAVITQLVTKSIEQGIGNVQSKMQKEIFTVQNKTQQQLNSEINRLGPKALYQPRF